MLGALAPGAIWVQMSTIGVEEIEASRRWSAPSALT